MLQHLRSGVIAAAVAALGAGAVLAYRLTAADPASGAACRSGSSVYARLELLFGLGREGGAEVSEEEWRTFIEMEITPRFPDGLTVLAGYGQWRGRSGDIAREPSRMLIIWYRRDVDSETRIEAIRTAYKAQFGQESVLRVDGLSCVSF